MDAKRGAGFGAAEFVEDAVRVGPGTGSTARRPVERPGERVRLRGDGGPFVNDDGNFILFAGMADAAVLADGEGQEVFGAAPRAAPAAPGPVTQSAQRLRKERKEFF